jgi:dienelactone hydrolase
MEQQTRMPLIIRPLILCFLLVKLSCDNETPKEKTGAISIARGTTNLMLEFESEADDNTIPVMVTLPSSAGAFSKAVVVLHGSGGPWDDDDTDGDGIADICNVGTLSNQNEEWRDLLNDEDFVAAFPDSYSPRNTCENEGAYKDPPLKFLISGTFVRNHDAFGVLNLLRSLVWEDTKEPVIDPDKIAVVGFSDGGTASISTLFDDDAAPPTWTWKQSFDGVTYTNEILTPAELPAGGGYKAGVIYYPGSYHNGYYGRLCDGEGIYRSYCDIMFHLADEDPLTENSECLIETMGQLGGGDAVVHHYGVGHGFDSNDEPESTLGRTRTITFLKEMLD